MTPSEGAMRLELGPLLAGALSFWRRRWATLCVLIVTLDWGPRFGLFLTGTHVYATGSRDPAAFAAFSFQSTLLLFCSLLMQASAAALALGARKQIVSAMAAIALVIRRLPSLAPWWVLISLPAATTLWIRWSSATPRDYAATYVWRLVGDTVFGITVATAIGLVWLVVLAENEGGPTALKRGLSLMTGHRGIIFVVAFTADVIGLIINLSVPYLEQIALSLGLGRNGAVAAAYVMAFLWEATAVVMNLAYVQLYRELVRAHDGVAPGELAHIFA